MGGDAAAALSGKAWAGAAHWRFRSAAQRTAAGNTGVEGPAPGKAVPRCAGMLVTCIGSQMERVADSGCDLSGG